MNDDRIDALRGLVRAIKGDAKANEALDQLARVQDENRRSQPWATRIAVERAAT